MKRLLSPYARIVESPVNLLSASVKPFTHDSEKCAYKRPRSIESKRLSSRADVR